ncbi:hypothetical protein B0A48_12020 [Cryoendolithus antarcticus]|uniref:Uncharacterized protein n=1 Tax=Cryoendolithus antarcticus TaxID=1507870 RepID=A0A1V8STJ4_9PEZI|nr:hypothetical protein B0A48_12020 [Cryoendolithus antarcticus]
MDSNSSNALPAATRTENDKLASASDSSPAPQDVTNTSCETLADGATAMPNDERDHAQSDGSAAATPPMSEIERVTRALLSTLSETAALIPETRPSCLPLTALQATTSTNPSNPTTFADAAATAARVPATGSTEQAPAQDNAAGISPELFGMLIGYGNNIRQLWTVANGTRALIDANAEAFGRELEELRDRFNMLEMQFDDPDRKISELSGEDDRVGPSTTKLPPTTKPRDSAPRRENEQWKQYVMKLVDDLNRLIDTQRPVVRSANEVIERSEYILELVRQDNEEIAEQLASGKEKGKQKKR